eukprot:2628824-Prymnesium_polylepis.1
MEHEYSGVVQLPLGPEPWHYDASKTKRRAGDWYLSVHALPGEAAEFSLHAYVVRPPPAPQYFECSRFEGFCPRSYYSGGPVSTSAATPSRRRSGAGCSTWVAAGAALPGVLMALGLGAARARSAGGGGWTL